MSWSEEATEEACRFWWRIWRPFGDRECAEHFGVRNILGGRCILKDSAKYATSMLRFFSCSNIAVWGQEHVFFLFVGGSFA